MSKQPGNGLRAASPVHSKKFDPWNSSSTGHQRADGRTVTSGTAWRDMRKSRVNSQFGGKGKENETPGGQGQKHSVLALLNKPGLMSAGAARPPESKSGIFAHTVVYINGSTYPVVSDHKLRRILVENGAQLSLHLARRAVTHVVLGKPGGGLAGGKMDKEIRRAKTGVRFVSAEWYVPQAFIVSMLTKTNKQGAGERQGGKEAARVEICRGQDRRPSTGQRRECI